MNNIFFYFILIKRKIVSLSHFKILFFWIKNYHLVKFIKMASNQSFNKMMKTEKKLIIENKNAYILLTLIKSRYQK